MAISRIRACQRYKVLLPQFQLDWTATTEDLKFCPRTSVLSWLLKIWSSASALPLCIDCQRSEAKLLHCLDYLWCEFPLLHLRSALTTHDVTWVLISTSALPILPKMWSSACALPSCLDCQRSEVQLPHFCSARTSKGLKFASALPLCLDCQICEVPLFKLLFCQDFERSQVPHPNLFDQDFQRCEGPLPHFISAGTSKNVKFLFRTSALPWLPKDLLFGCHANTLL